jgi:hypothetical protein
MYYGSDIDPKTHQALCTEKYEGDWVDGKMHGRGTYYYSDGSIYDGTWVEGKMEGKGIFIYPNGNKYEGEYLVSTTFCNIRYHTILLILLYFISRMMPRRVMVYYIIRMANVMKDNGKRILLMVYLHCLLTLSIIDFIFIYMIIGTGMLLYSDGDKYVGEWFYGKKSGHGELIYANGDKFSGNWLEDKASGQGRLEYCNGDVYDGQWEKDLRHGWGKFTSADTNMTYEGYWKDGRKV